ncbi:type II toxin-antitoxin system RelE/ParE family toxin [Candidatus Thiosymbion oneisti]|uniref:type II toxin-antitoxin system RelE/ParE family toxin n=1 Tax=Candidatus Thiosymbion oneisti TaxID=589554 RepID=UPI000B7E304E
MLILRKEAEDDMKEAHEWYEGKRTDLGMEFIYEVECTFEIIRKNPRLYAKVFKNVRRVLCSHFPYSIYFFERGSDIIVIGVLHQRRNPTVWQARQ